MPVRTDITQDTPWISLLADEGDIQGLMRELLIFIIRPVGRAKYPPGVADAIRQGTTLGPRDKFYDARRNFIAGKHPNQAGVQQAIVGAIQNDGMVGTTLIEFLSRALLEKMFEVTRYHDRQRQELSSVCQRMLMILPQDIMAAVYQRIQTEMAARLEEPQYAGMTNEVRAVMKNLRPLFKRELYGMVEGTGGRMRVVPQYFPQGHYKRRPKYK